MLDRYSWPLLNFFFRKTGPASAVTPSPSQKYTLKKVTSSIRLQNVFRRVSHGGSNNKQTEAEQVHKLMCLNWKKIFFSAFFNVLDPFIKIFWKNIMFASGIHSLTFLVILSTIFLITNIWTTNIWKMNFYLPGIQMSGIQMVVWYSVWYSSCIKNRSAIKQFCDLRGHS